jgi:ketosteroid isomerase-like protein
MNPSRHLPALLLLALVLCAAPGRGELPAPALSLVEAEAALAAAMSTADPRGAMLTRSAAFAVLLRPTPVSAPKWLPVNPPLEGRYSWQPAFVEISGLGDLGYTTGPWQVVEKAGGAVRRGAYLAIWRFHPAVGWQLLMHGANEDSAHAVAAAGEPPSSVGTASRLYPDEAKAEARKLLVDADRAYGTAAAQQGERAALAPLAADDIRLCRPGSAPAAGRDAVLAALPAAPAAFAINPIGARVADSGDLGYTYGTWSSGPAGTPPDSLDTWSYVHVWRLDGQGGHRLAMEFALPIPR